MTENADDQGEATLFPKTVGERLRDARVALKLELADVAQRTRVPLRHLQGIEDGDYSAMPTSTYAVGFAKAYARAVGEDEVEIAREIRGRAEVTAPTRRPDYQGYDIQEVPRTPSKGVMIAAVIVALALLAGALAWYNTTWFRGDGLATDPGAAASFTPENAAAPAAVATPAPVTGGQVTLVATDEVWVRVYDAANTTLKQGTMMAGERFDVPATATGPLINVGRPDKLQVLVNGSQVAPLGDGRVAIKDIGISAAALAARNQPAPAATATPGPTASPAAGPPADGREVPPYFRDQSQQTPPADPVIPPGERR